MSKLHPILWNELRKLDELDVLRPGEIMCDYEVAVLDTDPGALMVTDQRVLFVFASVLRRKTRVLSIELGEVTDASAHARRSIWPRNKGVVVVKRAPSEGSELEFLRVPGGETRAKQIAASIRYQRDVLKRLRVT